MRVGVTVGVGVNGRCEVPVRLGVADKEMLTVGMGVSVSLGVLVAFGVSVGLGVSDGLATEITWAIVCAVAVALYVGEEDTIAAMPAQKVHETTRALQPITSLPARPDFQN